MKAPLYNELIAYSHSKLAFHMPGHKFGTIADLNKLNLSSLDNTEAIGMDNLYEAKGIIKQSLNLMADFYGARETIFLTNGSTAGILAAILATCKEGDQLIIARNAHYSVWSGLIIAGIIPIYINPEYREEDGIIGVITPEIVEKALIKYPKAKGVLIVSPTYEGIVSDIAQIAEKVHKTDKLLIVDEAHGAHFILGNSFPLSSTRLGADIVINSMHKTLPALTQSALIHICSTRVQYEKVIEALRMVQTSSPSYMMMGLMDYIRCYILEHHRLIKKQYIDELVSMRGRLKLRLQKLRLIDEENEHYDISKVVISTLHTNITGYQLADALNKHYSIVVEAALEHYIILMTTMADQKETLSRLEEALGMIDDYIGFSDTEKLINYYKIEDICLGEAPRKIFYREKEWIELEHIKLQMKCATNIMLYPPGIPIVCIGEEITERHINIIRLLKSKLSGIQIKEGKVYIEVAV